MLRKRLYTPGPTSVPEEVLLEMARPVIHHRTPEFLAVAREVVENLKYVFQTQKDVYILASSGTGAMEAAVTNLLSPGDAMLAICGGKFGERFREIGQAFGLEVTSLDVEWGSVFDPTDVEKTLKKNPGIRAVFATLCETSTGTHFDIESLGSIVRSRPETALVVDTVSSLGAVPCKTDEWGLDMVVTGSQKALMLPPGLAFISVSEKAWGFIEKAQLPRYYFDLRKYRKAMEKSDFPFTMAVTLVGGLRSSLAMIRSRTIEAVWAEHHRRAEATRQAFLAMGLSLFSKAPSDGVTAVVLPTAVDGEKLGKLLRDQYGISVAGGQDRLKGRIVRISHLGWQDEYDVLTAVTAVGIGLEKTGHPVDVGKGIEAARSVLFV